MGMNVYDIGLSGLNAAMSGLVTTGHNISNASTPGFNRQAIVQTSNTPQATGSGFLGHGVSVTTVTRIYSAALANQLTLAQSQGSQLDAYNTQITQLDNMLGSTSAGLAPALQNFFSGVAAVAASPADVPTRQAMLSSANTLASTFQGLDQQFAQMRAGINTGITSSIASINGYAQQIASLNQSIVAAQGANAQQQPNDLLDQRDALITALNKQIGASVVKESNGSYDVFIGNGQPVVLGNQAVALAATPSPQDPQQMVVGYSSGASIVPLAQTGIQGGTLGGLLSFRSNSLDAAQNALGRVAMGVAQSVNQQNALGQDLNGALGQDIFSAPSPTVLSSTQNSGSATVGATLQNAAQLTTSDYQLQYTGASGGNETYQLTRLSDGAITNIAFPTGGSGAATVDGITLDLTTGANAKDSWLIQPTRLGAANIGVVTNDPAGIAAASPVATSAPLSNTGSASISAAGVSSVANLPLAGAVTLTYNAGQFTVSGAAPPAGPFTYTSGSNISFNGISFTISGAPANGDTFTVGPNTNGISDNRNALAMAALQTAKTLGQSAPGGQPTTSFGGAYGQLVNQIGNTAQQTGVMNTAQQNVITQATQAQQSVSGVNLDEEAANLLRYQQAYQASGKLMQIADTLFQSVLALGN